MTIDDTNDFRMKPAGQDYGRPILALRRKERYGWNALYYVLSPKSAECTRRLYLLGYVEYGKFSWARYLNLFDHIFSGIFYETHRRLTYYQVDIDDDVCQITPIPYPPDDIDEYLVLRQAVEKRHA